MMNPPSVTVHARIDARAFRRFALFDTFRLKKHGRLPLIFTAIMLAFSVVCFVSGREQSWLAGSVLALIGIGMPAVYFGTFVSQVNKKAEALKLSKPRPMYTLCFTADSITVHNDFKQETNVVLPWDSVWGAVRVREAIYFYAARTKAFILPDGQADAEDDVLWRFLGERLGKTRVTDKRPRGGR